MTDKSPYMGRKRIGLISDTHGLLRKSAAEALAGADMILHAGDVDTPEILGSLNRIALVYAVRGNMDRTDGGFSLPAYEIVETGGICIYVRHDLDRLDLDPAAAGFHVVVFGHSHRPTIKYKDCVLYINPGSAGPRRFTLPISVGMLDVADGVIRPRIIELRE